ncbi:serine kinase [Enterococcus faecalis]|uniref:Serine kinase n=1 Tax=Enterococcus faecalis TaxID=1351 RepID=A0A855U283_ENTFL|nr:serine kinase [Enterococcus faecalis]NRD95226.1 serine kinase [Enterococcus faecalis]NRE26770.1 serine kinase [Enterococcus faecalis]NRE38254.1 serine kinase [Enterococcus faecalis]OSM27770.1 serine kinase [Enterococcus faecalis]
MFCPTIRCKNIVADYRLEWVYESDQQKSIGIKRNRTEISQKAKKVLIKNFLLIHLLI